MNIHLNLNEGKLLVSKADGLYRARPEGIKSIKLELHFEEIVPGTEFRFSESTLPRQLPTIAEIDLKEQG